tara:strand:+ start:109 stop:759 length:651 start_codon:yes stop_codon:yes gene_type:complete
MFYIYKIWKECDENFYIGSTGDFHKRKWNHKSSCNNTSLPNHNCKIYSHIRANGGWDSWNMDIIEECETRDREIELIKEMKPSLNTVVYDFDEKKWREENVDRIKEQQKEYNKINADRLKEQHKEYRKKNADRIKENKKEYSKINADRINEYKKEYRKNNADRINERHKEYREKNTDKIKERANQKFNCECGGEYTLSNKLRHFRTKIHQKYLGSS